MVGFKAKSYWPRVHVFLVLALVGWGLVGLEAPGWWGVLSASVAIGASAGFLNVAVPFAFLVRLFGVERYWAKGIIFTFKDLALVGVMLAGLHLVETHGALQELTPAEFAVGFPIVLALAIVYAEPIQERAKILREAEA